MNLEPPPLDASAELVEALIRQAMAQHKAIEPRGFDSTRRRRELHDHIDFLLEKYDELTLLMSAEPEPAE